MGTSIHPSMRCFIFTFEIQLKSDTSYTPKNIFRTFLTSKKKKKHKITFRCNISGALRDASAATATKSFLPKNAIKTAWLKQENNLHWHTEVAEAMI